MFAEMILKWMLPVLLMSFAFSKNHIDPICADMYSLSILVECRDPLAIANAARVVYSSTAYQIGDSYRYTCNQGHTAYAENLGNLSRL